MKTDWYRSSYIPHPDYNFYEGQEVGLDEKGRAIPWKDRMVKLGKVFCANNKDGGLTIG